MEPRWREAWARLDIDYDDYIRTTEPRHERVVQKLLNAVHDNGTDDIYLGSYEGLYCVSCEAYYTEDQLIDGKCPIHERPVERMVEENYFFRLSAYADRLLEHYEEHPAAVEPETRRNEVLSTIRGGLQDFSISRTTFDWGIPLPWDPKHVCYVWFDALTNYITAAGYADDPERFARMWPANIHLIGKDILRQHAIYWPAMLMAAGLEPPTQVWAHGYLTVGGKKMSKTNLTGIHPFELIDRFGTDSYRYYFMREMRFGEDGSFSWESMVERHNADLANGLGNLASRIIAMIGSYFDGAVPAAQTDDAESDLPDRHHRGRRALRPPHAGRPTPARPHGPLGHRRQSQPLPRGERTLEARQRRHQPPRARIHPLHQRRNPPHPRRPDPPHHARRRPTALDPTRHPRVAHRPTPPPSNGMGSTRTRNRNEERRKPLPKSRSGNRPENQVQQAGTSAQLAQTHPSPPPVSELVGCPPRLHCDVRLLRNMFHVKLPPSTAYGDLCMLGLRGRPEP